jgi:hypothetical protein
MQIYAHTSQEIYDHRNKMTLLKRVQQTDLVQGSLYFPRISGETEIFKINTTTMAPNKRIIGLIGYNTSIYADIQYQILMG